jgi:hypothetical protein
MNAGFHVGRRGQIVPHSTTEQRYPGRTPHWIRGNAQERIPHRWIVADTESARHKLADGEQLRFRLACAVRWRDDLATGDHLERADFWDAGQFWAWVTDWCFTHGRTVLWFHNAGHDLGQLDAFRLLPALGYELAWCNLDRDVSVVTWRGPRGTLVIADTYTWIPKGLDELGGLVGVAKTRLPGRDDPDEVWLERCRTDVEATRRVVAELLRFVRDEHLGNWQPSGAGMGHTAWRHRFMDHKVLVHDDAAALEAERAAMHTGRAEAWWHGKAAGGPFTEWDMSMSYPRIAAECDLPAKLWEHDVRPSKKVHQFALDHWRTLARVTVTTDVPVVPARLEGRIAWPAGTFETWLWDTELQLISETGGSYTVAEQYRYTRKPALQAWAAWTLRTCSLGADHLHPIAREWVKHQGRAVIGRMALRTPSWEDWGENWLPYTGITLITPQGSAESRRMMHVGGRVLAETGRTEAANAVPQITSWIMAECRARLWRAAIAAGLGNVLHTDTDSIITSRAGTARMITAADNGLPGAWRPKATWRTLEITGPRHYRAPGRRQVPGVPKRAVETSPGKFEGEVWDSLARTLTEAPGDAGRIRVRTWEPRRIDYRRPYQGETDGPAQPIRLGGPDQEGNHHDPQEE